MQFLPFRYRLSLVHINALLSLNSECVHISDKSSGWSLVGYATLSTTQIFANGYQDETKDVGASGTLTLLRYITTRGLLNHCTLFETCITYGIILVYFLPIPCPVFKVINPQCP